MPEHPFLLAPLQARLEADQAVERALAVLLAQLHHRVRPPAGARVDQAHGPQRTEGERLRTAVGDLLDRLAAVEEGAAVEVVHLGALGGDQRGPEGLVLLGVEGGVQVVGLALLVARGAVETVEVERRAGHRRRDGVEEVQPVDARRAPRALPAAPRW